MSRYGMIQAIFMSFYSKKLYRDVAVNWGGKSLIYLLFILSLSWIYFTYQIQHGINTFTAKDVDKIVVQIPVVTINQGKVSTPENRPYEITDPDTKQKIAVIDATGQYKTLEEAKAMVLVTPTQVIAQTKPNETKIYDIPANLNLVADPLVITGYIKTFLGFSWIPFFICLLLFSFVYRLLQALLYSIIGKIVSGIANVQVTYGQCMQIVMVAITPAIIVATILDALGITFKNQLLCYFLLTILYLFYGILANKPSNQQEQIKEKNNNDVRAIPSNQNETDTTKK